MRSTRATAAVARLNKRSEGGQYQLVVTGAGLFKLRDQCQGGDASPALALEDFVRFLDALGPQPVRRVTKNDEAFAKQLSKKA